MMSQATNDAMKPGERFTDGHGRTWTLGGDGKWHEGVSIEEQLLRDIVETINSFDDDSLGIHRVHDGGGHFDFMGMWVKEPGMKQLKELIDKAVSDIRTLDRDPND